MPAGHPVRARSRPVAWRRGGLLSLAALALAAWASAAEPAVAVRLADAAALRGALAGGALPAVLDEAAAAPLRRRFADLLAARLPGIADPLEVLASCRAAQGAFAGLDEDGSPSWALQADLGTRAPPVLRSLVAARGEAWPARRPLADEAWSVDGVGLARFGGIVAVGRPLDALPLPPFRAAADVEVRCGLPALLRVVGLRFRRLGAALQSACAGWEVCAVRARAGADGMRWDGELAGDPSGLRPVPRRLAARLPADAIAALLLAADPERAPQRWGAAAQQLLRAYAPAAVVRAVEAGGGPRALLAACGDGLAVVATPGVPVPGLGLVLPRHPAIDAAAAELCAACGVAAPEEGGSAVLGMPHLPATALLSRAADGWLLTTDARHAAAWGAGGDGGFASAALGAALLRQAPAEACALLAVDAGPALRAALPLLGDLADALRIFDPGERQALAATGVRLSTRLGPMLQWGVAGSDRIELHGVGGEPLWFAGPALAAALGLPALVEASVPPGEAAAMRLLRSVLLPAQRRFQSDALVDQDADGIGEYALLSELAGRRPLARPGAVPQPVAELAAGDVVQGYRFAAWLPDGRGGAIGEPAGDGPRPSIVGPGAADDADEQEGAFVIYAWPAEARAGVRMFAIDASGRLRQRAWDGQAPQWNSLYGGGAWSDPPAWTAVGRGARRR